ncbi:hypothetical protein GWG65_29730 [Bradyrhizobium sp. CSA207]|uniref:hypothetical protein n=1 Tax=Bradyrhizobium sp. CSA207 TaxID=2698826 RepID=UPI0023AEF26C|nr:hypothetical protein [Bradyrhizobium sp. CSA207]MDE5445533.1 hypothetical protein [Bradyrhizobium sp. CSA207]
MPQAFVQATDILSETQFFDTSMSFLRSFLGRSTISRLPESEQVDPSSAVGLNRSNFLVDPSGANHILCTVMVSIQGPRPMTVVKVIGVSPPRFFLTRSDLPKGCRLSIVSPPIPVSVSVPSAGNAMGGSPPPQSLAGGVHQDAFKYTVLQKNGDLRASCAPAAGTAQTVNPNTRTLRNKPLQIIEFMPRNARQSHQTGAVFENFGNAPKPIPPYGGSGEIQWQSD